ncbi:unnamed protein product [Psylliodes chrysocephalus]|uniref:Uncharacterized protein n=1 Tax=Psylliodes chrysocephalus TaxID=3402493 RepID=A0A9P0G5V0_9CUCU|nr:unnamed protein product [Psylliodes chrysocephala]
MERISNSKTSASGTKSLTINSKLENQEKIGKNIYFATEAAVTLLLDNIATKKEIKYILQADALLRNTFAGFEATQCEFCKKKCNKYKVCCSTKEMQILLVNNAVQKLGYISLSSKSDLLTSNSSLLDKKPQTKITESKEDVQKQSEDPLNAARKNTLKRIKKRMNNLRKFYPDIFYCKDNIIEKWAQYKLFKYLKQDLINIDAKAGNVFLI